MECKNRKVGKGITGDGEGEFSSILDKLTLGMEHFPGLGAGWRALEKSRQKADI